ncbi:MAG: adenosylcobinamide-GDP ribazoletransferase [Rhodobacteraceae bacterium]|nr:adenosylcobinamide-GDP ribazoletransferase [Paracoccaceae bacterium]
MSGARRAEAALALQFLTRLPLGRGAPYSPEAMARAVAWFPAVGLVTGGLAAAVFWAGWAMFSAPVGAILALLAGVLVTGGLHEDGLADLADGLGGGATRARALEIMRDSRIGSYGALALGLGLALKAAALAGMGPGAALGALVGAHVLGRYAMVWLMGALPYARTDGAAGFARPGLDAGGRRLALGTALAALAGIWILAGIGAALVAALWVAVCGRVFAGYLHRRLGGYTGDALGALEQLIEAGVLLCVLAWV